MKRGKASWTAEITAIYRAVESQLPAGVRLFDDPYARSFLRWPFRLLLKSPALARWSLWFWVERRFPGGYDSIAARIRYVDDSLLRSLALGIRQVVILGAGYDARALRFKEQLHDARVYEIDHPSTQRVKKRRLMRRYGRLPQHVVYVPGDFEKASPGEALAAQGYRGGEQSVFIWEGGTKYLTAAAVNRALAWMAADSAAGSRVVFDYLLASMLDGRRPERGTEKILAYQQKKGEPYRFGIEAAELTPWLTSLGFSSVERTTAVDLKRRYLSPLNRGKTLHTFWELAQATV